ncbi:MAG: tRNA pseudouridine(38-40) synthase TruA [Prevotellaceae bacterium]|nr:tRNA pseudouridine(38-40) synthase TruA [Prevotellaceae bacterium]
MKRYFIYLAYNGTAYCGWQMQNNGTSVQQVLTAALRTVLREPSLTIMGAGRTDTGVHATEMVAHFDVNEAIENAVELCGKLNRFLPKDIAVKKIIPVKNDAHARFDAVLRQYEYHIITEKNVFKNHLAARFDMPLDFEKMNIAAAVLKEYRDFTSFSKLHTDVKTNNCQISAAKWEQRGDEWVFVVAADRFLRNMVRAIVGTLLEVGKGKISLDEFRGIIESKNRNNAGMSVPAHGLYLVKVEYPNNE